MDSTASTANKIADSLKPQTKSELVSRAGVFTYHLSRTCVDDLTKLLADVKAGTYGTELQDVFTSLRQENFWPAAKELICVSARLTAMDQDVAGEGHWITAFASSCLNAADKVIEDPSAEEIMEVHNDQSYPDSLAQHAALSICHQLGFANHSQRAAEPLEKYLKVATKYRFDLLTYVLTQPLDVLVESTKPSK